MPPEVSLGNASERQVGGVRAAHLIMQGRGEREGAAGNTHQWERCFCRGDCEPGWSERTGRAPEWVVQQPDACVRVGMALQHTRARHCVTKVRAT